MSDECGIDQGGRPSVEDDPYLRRRNLTWFLANRLWGMLPEEIAGSERTPVSTRTVYRGIESAAELVARAICGRAAIDGLLNSVPPPRQSSPRDTARVSA